jgi:hypothetical protein
MIRYALCGTEPCDVDALIFSFSPRYTPRLADNIERLGGARYMFLTHMYVLDLCKPYTSAYHVHVLLDTKAYLTSHHHTVMMWRITGSGLNG